MNFVELFINNPVNAKLDLDSEVSIGLQYSIADIRDISKRNSAYSKTIILPGTKNNNYWMGNLFDVNADFTAFNPNRKTDAKLLVNSEPVIDGFLQLRKINKLINADMQGNLIQYEIVIYNNAVDLMTSLGEKTIDQLNLSEFEHVFSYDNIVDSWVHTYEDGYVYPMYGTDQTTSAYKAQWFWPNMFYKTVLDRILNEAGFGWTGSLKTNEQFDKELIAYVADGRPKISESERRRREFRAGPSASAPILFGTFSSSPTAAAQLLEQQRAVFNNDFTDPNFDNDDNWDTTTYQWELDRNGIYSGQYLLSGTFSLYNPSTQSVIAQFNPLVNGLFGVDNDRSIAYTLNSRVVIERTNGTTQSWPGSLAQTSYQMTLYSQSSSSPLYYVEGFGKTFSAGLTYSFSPFNFTFNLPTLDGNGIPALGIGDKVFLELKVGRKGDGFTTGNTKTTPDTYWDGNLQGLIQFNTNSYFKNTAVTADLTQGDLIDLGDYLPDKVKQKDLITDLIKRYNLYISVDPDNDRLLIMDPRPDYYNSGEVLDWTDKKDFSSEDNIELLSELQFKEMMFTYKADKDWFNESYTAATGDVYGQYKYNFDNDFVKGEKKVESPFSPTPLVYNSNVGAHLPAIDPIAPKIQPRILYWGGLLSSGNAWTMDYQDVTTGLLYTQGFNSYPYAGHFDNPISPTLDINFGTCKYYFYNNYNFLTNNNMYNTYWSDYIQQIEEGRLVTSKFYLDEFDIRYIKENFNSKIFVLDSYYYVNKIKDYNPLKNDVTEVELIKIVGGITWEGQTITTTGGGLTAVGPLPPVIDGPIKPVRPVRPVRDWGLGNILGDGGIVIGHNNNGGGKQFYELVATDWILANGTWDDEGIWIDDALWDDTPGAETSSVYKMVYDNRQFVFGDSNNLNNDFQSVFMGDRNTLEGTNTSVFNGSDNFFTEDAYNVTLIQANGLTVSEPNTIYLGNSFSVNTQTGIVIGPNGTQSALGTTNYISKFTGPSELGDSVLVDDGTYLYIDRYGGSSTPSFTWNDSIGAGFWKNSSGEREWHLGTVGITVSTIRSKGMSLNNLVLDEHRYAYRNVNATASISISDYVVAVVGPDTGIKLTLPGSLSAQSGKFLYIKNILNNPTTVNIEVNDTGSETIDVYTDITLDHLDSVTLCCIGSSGWMIV